MVLVVPSPPSAATAAAVAVTLPLLHEFTGSLFRLHQRRRLVVTRVPLPDDAAAWTSGSVFIPHQSDCLPLFDPPSHVLLSSLPLYLHRRSSFSVFVALFRDFRLVPLSFPFYHTLDSTVLCVFPTLSSLTFFFLYLLYPPPRLSFY